MRAIDADDILLRFDKRMTYEAGRNHAYLKGVRDVMKEIDAARTVDAIPVEWLNNKMLDLQNKDKALSRAAWLVLHAWQKEQEAR